MTRLVAGELADPDGVKAVARWGAKNYEVSDVEGLGMFGTAEIVSGQNRKGGLPTHNWDSGVFDGATYAAVVLVIAYTTLFSPFWIKLFYRLFGKRSVLAEADAAAGTDVATAR